MPLAEGQVPDTERGEVVGHIGDGDRTLDAVLMESLVVPDTEPGGQVIAGAEGAIVADVARPGVVDV